MATRGTLTSSFSRKSPHNASLKLKAPDTLHLQQSPSSDCLCSINVSREKDSPARSCNDSSEGATHNDNDEEEDVEKKQNQCDVSRSVRLNKLVKTQLTFAKSSYSRSR